MVPIQNHLPGLLVMDSLSGEQRAALEATWLRLTKEVLPALARQRSWPIRLDHCFQRVLLDAACGGCWYEYILRRPAYRYASDAILLRAVSLAESAANAAVDLHEMNLQSLRWRGKFRD